MISSNDLNKCIDNLAEINANISSTSLKRKLLEVGYILKQELETVDAWDKRVANEHNVKTQNIDISKLLADNTQLYNENKKLQEVILKLKGVIDEKIPQMEKAFSHISDKITVFTDAINQ